MASLQDKTTFTGINDEVKKSNNYQVLVYGCNDLNYDPKQNNYHLKLLFGLMGERVSIKKQTSMVNFNKNGVEVTIHVGSHSECIVTADEVDLLILFLPLKGNALDKSYTEQTKRITEARGADVWKHAVIVLTGVDVVVAEYSKQGNAAVRLESGLKTWTAQLQQSVAVDRMEVKVLPAGGQNQPDLPKPHMKWFSQLWFECFLSSKVSSLPAIFKLAQHRIVNSVKNSEIQDIEFFEQQIEIKKTSVELPTSIRVGLGIGGGGAVAGAAAAGATTGALIGALAIGIPSFGIAAGLGLLIGAVVGGGAGAGIAGAALGGTYHLAKSHQNNEIDTSDVKKYYAHLLTCFPSVRTYLTRWAEKKDHCTIVVAGIERESISTVASTLIGRSRGESSCCQKEIRGKKFELIVHDFPGFPQSDTASQKVKVVRELVHFLKKKDVHLLFFCIPLTSFLDFGVSVHAEYLERLLRTEYSSNIVIALTRTNELRMELAKQNDLHEKESCFNDRVKDCKEKIRDIFGEDRIPIVPVDDSTPLTNFGPSTATPHHSFPDLLLQAMPATKLEGLPALLRISRYYDIDEIKEHIIKNQCLMFSKVGQRARNLPGETIGLILGSNEKQNW